MKEADCVKISSLLLCLYRGRFWKRMMLQLRVAAAFCTVLVIIFYFVEENHAIATLA